MSNYVNPLLEYIGRTVPDVPVDEQEQAADEARIAESNRISAEKLTQAQSDRWQKPEAPMVSGDSLEDHV